MLITKVKINNKNLKMKLNLYVNRICQKNNTECDYKMCKAGYRQRVKNSCYFFIDNKCTKKVFFFSFLFLNKCFKNKKYFFFLNT